MEKIDEYQVYKLYKDKKDKKVEALLKDYEKNGDIGTILHPLLKQILMSTTKVNIYTDIIMTVLFLTSNNKNIKESDKKSAKRLFRNFNKMNKLNNMILDESYNITKILRLPKFHSHEGKVNALL